MRRTLALVAVASLTAVACGTGSSEISVDDGRGVLAAAANRAEEAGSARVSFESTMRTWLGPDRDEDQTFETSAEGVTSFDPPAMDLAFTISVPSTGEQTIRMRMIDDTVYTRLPEEMARQEGLPAGVSWVSYTAPEVSGGGFVGLGFGDPQDPTATLDALRAVSDEVRETGSGEVRGAPTTVYEASVSLRRMLEQHAAEQPDTAPSGVETEMDLEGYPSTFPVRVWMGEDGLPRRIEMQMSKESTTASTPSGGDLGAQAFEWVMTFELWDWGVDVDVTAPPAAETVEQEELSSTSSGSESTEAGDEQPLPDFEITDEGVYRLEPVTPEAAPSPEPTS